MEVFDWPSQSLNLNSIGHMWEAFKRAIKDKKARNADVKFIQFESAWTTIDALIDSMVRRYQAVTDAKGYPKTY